MPQAYRVKRADRAAGGRVSVEVGEIVYQQVGYDYGLSRDDEFVTGIEHISVTRNRDGDYPGFTIPVADLEPVNSEEAA